MPTREQTRGAWSIVKAIAATQHVTIFHAARGCLVCKFCGGEARFDEDTMRYVPVHTLDCPYLGAQFLMASVANGCGEIDPSYSTYFAPVIAHLAAQENDSVTLTLEEIEAMVRRKLPDSAYVNTSYWVSGAEARLRWHVNGWSPFLHIKARAVEFRRIVPGARP